MDTVTGLGLSSFAKAFVVGGAICVLAQLTLDLTKLTGAHVMVLFVVLGAIVSGFGLYEPLIAFAGAGAAIPLPAFGHALVAGTLKGAAERGFIGFVSGGLTATATGLTVAILFGFTMALVFRPRG